MDLPQHARKKLHLRVSKLCLPKVTFQVLSSAFLEKGKVIIIGERGLVS
jgi:hypothetical protein